MTNGIIPSKYRGKPLRTDMRHSMVNTMNGVKKEMDIFAPATYENSKVMEPERDIRYGFFYWPPCTAVGCDGHRLHDFLQFFETSLKIE